MSDNASTTQGLTRRELLKRGAALGGALAWATPAVQLVGMQRAMAAHVSEVCFCVKNDPPGSTTFITLTGSSGECLDPAEESCTDPVPSLDGEFTVTNNNDGTYTIKYPINCSIAAVSIKCGGGAPGTEGCDHIACFCQFDVTPDDDDGTFNYFDVADSQCKDDQTSISHIEICFQC